MALDFAPSEDQSALADAFGSFFAAESPLGVVRDTAPTGFSPSLWAKLATLGAPGMRAAAEAGGGGATVADALVVTERLGATMAPVPLVEHLVATAGHSVEGLVSGAQVATLALRPAVDTVWRLVPAGAVADVVVGVEDAATIAVVSAPPPAVGPNHADQPLADRSTHGDRVELGPAALMDALLDEWRILTAGALVGLADAAMCIGVDYVLERQQFGRPIGSFQAIQHGLADLPGLIDGARFLAHKAAWAVDGGHERIDMAEGVVAHAGALASMAFLQAAEAAAVSTDRALHYHGGYGFSEEYDIQMFFRRARGWAGILGDPATERRRLADILWSQAS